ncbi:toxin-antitoxin system YwqK family antitoxin [Aquirufa lenticrescens]
MLSLNLLVQAQNKAITINKPLIDTSVHEKGLLNGRLSTGLESKAAEAKKFKEDSKAFIESLGVKDLGKKIVKTAKKKLQPRDEYAGIKTERKLGNYGSGVRMTVEEVNVVKYVEDEALSPYASEIFIFDPSQSRVVSIPLKDTKNVQICHGPFKKYVNQKLIEEGFYYMGVKDGRWESYGSENELENKVYYEKGYTAGSHIAYYDAAKKKIKEVIPRLYGKVRGTYYSFYPSGSLKEDGRMDDSVKVGRWREYHEFGSGGRLKKEWRFGKDKFDPTEPMLIQERDQQSKVIFQAKEPVSQHKPLQIPPMDSDDEDSEDEDGSEDANIIRNASLDVLNFCFEQKNLPDLRFELSTGYFNTLLTPPDFNV